jgi:hypothetical protein
VPGDGTVSLPAAIAALAAAKKAGALQAATCVNDENLPLMSSPEMQLACCRRKSEVGAAAGNSYPADETDAARFADIG